MAGRRIMQTDIRKLIKLYESGKSIRWISKELDNHRKTVKNYIFLIKDLGLSSQTLEALSDKEIYTLFDGEKPELESKYQDFCKFIEVHKEDRRKPGFTIFNLFKIYKHSYPDGYGRSQFYDRYTSLIKQEKGSVRLEHKYGEKLFIDFAGKPLHLVDKASGEMIAVKVYVGVLPASNYTYVEAVADEKKHSFIKATENCLKYIGGVPECIVPDNLKSAVSKSNKYEPIINKSFKDLADHYDTVIHPTRVYSPKDKAMVEGMVRIIYQEIYFPIRNMTFFTFEQLNEQIQILLEKMNNKLLNNRDVSRKDLYEQERKYLKELPVSKFEMWEYKKAKVQKMGYVYFSVQKNYYSIPFRYIGKQVELRYNTSMLEVHYRSERIAIHKISQAKGYYTTINDHLCSANQKYLEWSPDFFITKAFKIGGDVGQYIKALIDQNQYPETAYRQCLGIMSLQKTFGMQRLNTACKMAISQSKKSYTMIKQILENEADMLWAESQEEETPIIPLHKNIRGKNHYS